MKIHYLSILLLILISSSVSFDLAAQPTPAEGSGEQNQSVCPGQDINDIIFNVIGEEPNVVFNPINSGLAASWNNGLNILTISGTPLFAVTYTVTDDADESVSGTITFNTVSTEPTSIAGTTSFCLGDNTTLTAIGGINGTGTIFQWYTGSCGGTLIEGETSGNITVSPGSNTSYFVRRTGTCNTTTCATVTVTVNTPSTAPTSISGSTTICSGESTTLTAIGGTSGSNAIFQWYAGGCGTGSALSTISTLNVSPTSTTTYFVRRTGTCNTTTCASVTVTVNTPSTAPTSITGVTAICPSESTILTAVGGSDGTGASFQWYAGGCGTGPILGTEITLEVSPNSTTTYCVRRTGTCNTTSCACVTVTVNIPSSAPVSVSGDFEICPGESTILTAVGGTEGTGAFYQWYTGSCGGTLISGESDNSITVSPSSNTTYFVRINGTCGTTSCANITINVLDLSTAPTSISGYSGPICPDDCLNLIANGAFLGDGASLEWYEGACGIGEPIGSTPILAVCPTESTIYNVRIVGDCNTTNCINLIVEVNTESTAPTISGVPAICSGSSTALTAVGGVNGTGATFEWYQGGCGNGAILSSNSTYQAVTTGTYFVRLTGTCNTTECASIVIVESITPNITPMTTTVCSGSQFCVIPEDGTNGIIPDGTVFAWSPPICTGGMTPGNSGQNQNAICNTHSHNTSSTQTATYDVFATAPGNCISSFSLVVDVVPGPGINEIPDYSFCNGEPIIISPFTSPTSGVDWEWFALDPSLGIESGTINIIPNNPAIFFPEDPDSPATTNIVVTATSLCSSETSFTLTVYPTPFANAISDMTFCEGSVVPENVISGTPNDVLFDYQSSGDNIGLSAVSGIGVIEIPSFVAESNTPPSDTRTFQITPKANGCEGNEISFQITVIEEPENPLIIDDWVDNSLCGNSYGQVISAETPFPATYSWSASGNVSIIAGVNNQNCVVNFLELGQGTLTVTADYGGCSSTSQVTYTIGDSPNPPLCATIASTPDGNGLVCLNNDIDSYQWGSIVVESGPNWLQAEEDNSGNGNDQFYYGDLLQDTIGKKIFVTICRDGCCMTVFYPDGCTDSPVLSILESENSKSGVHAYPNPTTGIVSLLMPSTTSGNIKILITDISGKVLLQREEYAYASEIKNIDLTEMTPGIYYISVTTKEFGETVVKLLKH